MSQQPRECRRPRPPPPRKCRRPRRPPPHDRRRPWTPPRRAHHVPRPADGITGNQCGEQRSLRHQPGPRSTSVASTSHTTLEVSGKLAPGALGMAAPSYEQWHVGIDGFHGKVILHFRKKSVRGRNHSEHQEEDPQLLII